jgi:polar amino acid transport system substrate-binding protein
MAGGFMRRYLLLAILLMAAAIPELSFAQAPISAEIAPTGKLRVATSVSTSVLLARTSDGKITGGVALDVGKFIAEKLGVPFQLVSYSSVDTFTQSFGKGEWDVGFGSRTPLVSDKADFIEDVVLTDYMYVAAPGREFATAAQVDRPGVKIGAGQNSVSDHFLSRTLKSAELVRISGGEGGVEELRTGKVDVWATGATNAQRLVDRLPGAKVVPGAFTSDSLMVTLPKGKSSAAQSKVAEIVKEAKRDGMVRKAIEQLSLQGVQAAPD